MFRTSANFRQMSQYGLGLALWIVANCVALAWIDVSESWNLEIEFHVRASVIRSYQSRTAVVPLNNVLKKGDRHLAAAQFSAIVDCCSEPVPVLQQALKDSRDHVLLWYRFRPAPWSAGTHSVPLVVFLHGAGESGSENVRQLQSLPAVFCEEPMHSLYPCAILAPQCPKPGGWSQRLDAETDVLDGVVQMIDEVLTDSRIDPNRIYLIGLSMGGYGTWELAMRAPDRFAAVVPICGGGDQSRAASLSNVPLWAVHGADDSVVAVSESRKMIAAVESAGGKPRYLELPGIGHDCWALVFREESDVLAWMFCQVRKSASP